MEEADGEEHVNMFDHVWLFWHIFLTLALLYGKLLLFYGRPPSI